MKIKEIIVVEGKHDSEKLKRYFDCDTIETSGTHLGNKTLKCIRLAQEKRGIIIFTDPDAPGEKIRNTINQAVPGCKNAFIMKDKAKTSKKVGVEHASKEDLEASLSHLMTYSSLIKETLSWDEYIELGFNGRCDSALHRAKIGEFLFIGKANAKTLFKRLNMLQLTKADCIKIMEELSL